MVQAVRGLSLEGRGANSARCTCGVVYGVRRVVLNNLTVSRAREEHGVEEMVRGVSPGDRGAGSVRRGRDAVHKNRGESSRLGARLFVFGV